MIDSKNAVWYNLSVNNQERCAFCARTKMMSKLQISTFILLLFSTLLTTACDGKSNNSESDKSASSSQIEVSETVSTEESIESFVSEPIEEDISLPAIPLD